MTNRSVRVGEVLALDRVLIAPRPEVEYCAIGMRSFGKGIFHYEPQPGDKLGSLRFFKVEPGRLVISNIKGWEGAIAVSTNADSGCVASNRFLQYRPVDDQIDVDWARWFFLAEPGLELIRRASPGSADRNRTLAIERFENLEIPLPEVDVQRRIASRVSGLHNFTGDLIQRIAGVSDVTRSLSVSATSRPDLDDATRMRLGWQRLPLSDVLDQLSPDVSAEPSTSYSIAGIFSFGRGLIDRGTILGAETSYTLLQSLSEGDVVISKLNGWEGAVAVIPSSFDGYCVSPEFPTFRLNRARLIPGYFGGIARSPWFWDALNTNVRGSMVRRRRINASQFLQTEIWLPPIETQTQVAVQLRATDRIEKLHANGRALAEALVPAALNQAFSSLT